MCHRPAAGCEVEIRSLDRPLNSCGCADHWVNGLGTCKHIEGVLARLRLRGVREFAAAEQPDHRAPSCFCHAAGHPSATALGQRIPWCSRHFTAETAHSRILRLKGSPRCYTRSAGADSTAAASRVAPCRTVACRRATPRGTRQRARRFLAEVAEGRQTMTCCVILCCPISARGCCISPSVRARYLAATWGWAEAKRSLQRSCCAGYGIARVWVVSRVA